MNSNQQQRRKTVQISGRIQNFRKIATKSGRPMAVFAVGGLDAKCFDLSVNEAESCASTQKWVRLTGHFSSHAGNIELVAETIVPVTSLSTDTQSRAASEAIAETSVQGHAPMRESSVIIDNLSGAVSNIRTVPTQSGRLMVTFMLGSTRCKAFGEPASAIQNTVGKRIEVSARKGSFQGTTEYSVEALKTIDGNLVALKDTRTVWSNEHNSKSAPGPQASAPHAEMDSDAFEALLRGAFEPISHSVEGEIRQPPLNPGQGSSLEERTKHSGTSSKSASVPMATGKCHSELRTPADRAQLQERIQLFRGANIPDKYLEERLKFGSVIASEAARRVLEERAKQRVEENPRSEDVALVAAA
jgi:hypothetical protein